jgi:hypothetical protein
MACYVYYSYEEWGRGYIGVKLNSDPVTDDYYGSYYDKTFYPTCKIVLGEFETPEEALEAEIALHNFFEVDKNPHFANRARQTSTGFISLHKDEKWRRKISEAHRGKKLSPETIAKRQATRGPYAKGKDSKKFGTKHTPETKAKIKEARAKQTNTSGGCSYPWWVTEDGTRTRALECPGEDWQRGMKWDPRGKRDGKNRRWVNKEGKLLRSPVCPGEGWQNGSKWKD